MKFLFVIENLTERCRANVNIAINIARALARKGHSVYVLTQANDLEPVCNVYANVFLETFVYKSMESRFVAETTTKEWSSSRRFKKVIKVLIKPSKMAYLLDCVIFNRAIERRLLQREISEICEKGQIDAVIGVSCPHYISHALSDSILTGVNKAIIQLDPYTYNRTYKHSDEKKRLRAEKYIYDSVDTIFAPAPLINEIKEHGVFGSMEKYVEIEFPCIITDKCLVEHKLSQKPKGNLIKCVYTGTFYKDIRNPRFLLELFYKLPSNYVLYIAGSGCEDIIDEYKTILGSRLVYMGAVSKLDADKLLDESDILINVNNSVSNQLPSKLFELIQNRKIILNLYNDESCLSIPYVNKYKKAINICEKDNITKQYIERIERMIKKIENVDITYEEIINIYEKNTDEYVSDIIVESMCKIGSK